MVEEYSKVGIAALLMEYAETDDTENERLVIMRCDLELALGWLDRRGRRIANTVLLLGSTDDSPPQAQAVAIRAVTHEEFDMLVRTLHHILNIQGIGGVCD